MRVLTFEQIVDDRFDTEIKTLLKSRLAKLEQLLKIDGVKFSYDEPYQIDWKTNIQYRARCYVRKTTRKVTWNDIYKIVNSVKAVPYDFINA